jgi:hypothetical protein
LLTQITKFLSAKSFRTTTDSPDPRIPDSTADPDNDGVSNLDEYRHNTKPRVANSDQGQPTAPEQKLCILT